MHLKEAYYGRIRQQQQRSSPVPKHSNSPPVGSIHTGQVNYDRNSPFFIDLKLRKEVIQAKHYVNSLKDADILEINKKQWNSSVAAPRKFADFEKEEQHQTKLLKIKLGFSDFSPIKDKANRIYEGVETRDSFAGWNVSTYCDKSQKKQGHENTNLNAFDNSIKFNASQLKNYKSLNRRYQEDRASNKSSILASTALIQDMKNSFMFTNPNSSPERANANVKRMFSEHVREKLRLELKSQMDTVDSLDHMCNFKAKLSPTQQTKIKYVHYHTGSLEKSPLGKGEAESEGENEEECAWSCCQGGPESAGCSYRVEDGNRMNLSSFNHA